MSYVYRYYRDGQYPINLFEVNTGTGERKSNPEAKVADFEQFIIDQGARYRVCREELTRQEAQLEHARSQIQGHWVAIFLLVLLGFVLGGFTEAWRRDRKRPPGPTFD